MIYNFLKRINLVLRSDDHSVIDIFDDPRVALVVLGGSTLKEWVNQHYLKNLGLPEVHIYDRDELQRDGKYKYQAARDAVNARRDGSIAFLTTKREMENYLHFDAIEEALRPVVTTPFVFNLTDDCDVEGEIERALGQGKIQRRSIKHWLNEDAASLHVFGAVKSKEWL